MNPLEGSSVSHWYNLEVVQKVEGSFAPQTRDELLTCMFLDKFLAYKRNSFLSLTAGSLFPRFKHTVSPAHRADAQKWIESFRERGIKKSDVVTSFTHSSGPGGYERLI